MSKPRFLIINGAQFGYSSGHYFYCKYLSDSFDLNYICFDRGLNKIVLEGVEVFYVSFSGNQLLRICRFIKECITKSYIKRPDILFVTYFNICFLLAVLCKSDRKVLDIRTGSLKKSSVIRGINNSLILVQSLFYKEIVILSDSLRRKLHISGGKSTVVPLGSEVYFSGNHKFDALNLLYVGSLDDRRICDTIKGFHLFLQNLANSDISINYTIVGFGAESETSEITNCISENNISNKVKFVGRKTHEELMPYFEQSNLGIAFVPLTPWYNCQPLTKLFEYLLSGMSVIATNTFENRQIVNENNGVLIKDTAEDFCKGLGHIYNRRETYNSSMIRKSVEQYTWDKIVNNTLKPYLLELLKKSD